MGDRILLTVQLLVVLCYFVYVSANNELCGLAKDDPDKICVSIRLPWQDEPIFFCQDKDKIKYRRHCGNGIPSCGTQSNKGHLLIATPWDCCPLSSIPDICTSVQCPPKPFNRTCVDVLPKEDSGECCAQPFCEEGVTSNDECHKKILEPSCQEPPKDKTKCVGFQDPHGCCTKFQCEGDGKPGLCPMEKEAHKYNANSNVTEDSVISSADSNNVSKTSHSNIKRLRRPYGHPHVIQVQVSCVGDYNCPGKLKCCSNEMKVYSDGQILTKSEDATYGFCVDPVKM